MLVDTHSHSQYSTLMKHRSIAIDIENLYGDCSPQSPYGPLTEQDVAALKRVVEGVYDCPETPAVVASSHAVAKAVMWGWPEAGRRWRSGPDGADLALLNEYTPAEIAERFARVILASGDGIFTDFVAECGRLGVRVDVLSRPEALSSGLRSLPAISTRSIPACSAVANVLRNPDQSPTLQASAGLCLSGLKGTNGL